MDCRYTFVDGTGATVRVRLTINEAKIEDLARHLTNRARGRKEKKATVAGGVIALVIEEESK